MHIDFDIDIRAQIIPIGHSQHISDNPISRAIMIIYGI